jgi:molecular chaperone GrpE
VSKHHPQRHEPDRPTAQQAAPPPAGSVEPPAADQTTPQRAENVKSEAAQQPAPQDALGQLRAELAVAKDRELRAHAELDNYRKRAARQIEEHARYAAMPLLRDLLPVVDNVDRAIQAAEKTADAVTLLEGFKLLGQQLDDVLKRHHCTRIEALDAPFDPNLHHAVMQQPSEDHPANTVLMVTQNGYQLHDRVVRPSQVIVSKPK